MYRIREQRLSSFAGKIKIDAGCDVCDEIVEMLEQKKSNKRSNQNYIADNIWRTISCLNRTAHAKTYPMWYWKLPC